MYLKSLKLTGFKSFADRTRLDFRPGVTVIVGPNGSGKSNIVDALSWVMGTQSPKALRTSKMDDVIFAGTATRPGLARAEVTLVFDNESGMLPLDLPEVSVTRRLYRDGSSDYEINGVGCRLLDIQELLSDSGVGRHQHVIIGQGQITSVLNATPDDHRAVIEEAAGILKHRVRRDKAERRLERTDGDVTRLHDLLGELSRQMRPLKRQAAAAERFDGVAAEAQALRLFLGGQDLRTITARQSEVRGIQATANEIVATRADLLSDLGSELESVREEAGMFGQALERDTAAAARLETLGERLRRIAQVAAERARTSQERIEGAEDRRQGLEAERRQLEAELTVTEEEQRRLTVASEAAERAFRSFEDEERSLADQESMSTEGAIAVVRGDLRSLEASDERDRRESKSLSERIEGLERRIAEHVSETAGLNTEIRDLDSIVVEAQDRFHSVQAERVRLQGSWERAEAMHNESRVGVAAAAARLTAVEEAAEGLADPESRSVVEAVDGYAGTIVSLLDVPDEYAAAVDAVLGHLADALVLEANASIEDAIAALKSKGLGGVSVVQFRDVEQSGATIGAPVGVTWLPGVLGSGADRKLAVSMLGSAHLSESWKSGWQLSQTHPDSVFVTLEGDIFRGGTVRVAHPDGATPAMMENAQVELERAETELARSQSLLTQSKRAFDDAREAERDALETLESLEARLSGATDSLGRSERVVVESETELSRLTDRLASLREAIEDRAHQRAVLTERLANLEGEEAERQRAWEELTTRRNEVARRRESARAEWQTFESDVTSMAGRRSMMDRRIATIGELLDAETRSDESPERIERLLRVEASARRAFEILAAHLEGLRRRQADLREQAGEAGRRLDALTRTERQYRTELDEAERRLSRMAVEEAELRVRFEAVAERLRRDADATEAEAMAAPRPDIESDDLPGVLRSREAELKRMGPINPLAAEEYAELSERHAFLSAQLEDLEESRSELRRIIEALDTEIHNQFLEAYTEIAAAYEENFTVLFPGGRGRLGLTAPDDPMTSGVEIGAQPVGKRVAKMSLLSGGERSLAALAFLFAVFKARPSPFYILDEVEAALDDANLRRFLRLLASFRDSAQLMIVTHQQQTMESGDVLYGVTMEPGGSSKVIAKAMSEVEQTV